MTRNRRILIGRLALVALIGACPSWVAGQAAPDEPPKLLEPKPLVPGAKVVTLWPAGSPMLKTLEGWDKPEVFNMSRGRPDRVESVVNIHNPSIEVHLAPADKAVNGGGKVQRGAGEMGDTRFPTYLSDGLLSMACEVSSAAVPASPATDRRRRLASLSR